MVAPGAPARASAPPATRFVLTPAASTIFTIEGHLPPSGSCPGTSPPVLRAKYRGRLEFLAAPDGTVDVIERVPFQTYLEGLAEVPPSWPDAALQAQAIAARSYAIDALRHPNSQARTLEYDICASDACQVYRGATVALGAFGDRWVRAVRSTTGSVLTYRGRVIPAYYFSTSDGRTRRAFPGGTPEPWLPSVTGEDSDAPLAHWTQRIPRARYDAVLRAAGASVNARLSNAQFRTIFNAHAACMFPTEFPGALPQTVPSEEFSATWVAGVLVLNGRGWGHGVGMSQWGAHSLAVRGRTATSILHHYYGPAEISKTGEPGEIRVLAIQGMKRVLVSASGPFEATTTQSGALAPGDRFEIDSGKELRILRGRGPSLAPVLSIMLRSQGLTSPPGATITIPFTLSGPARVQAVVDGVPQGEPASYVAGDGTIDVLVPDAHADHHVTLVASDALDTVQSAPVAVTIAAPPPPPAKRSRAPWWIAAAALALVLAGALGARLIRR